MFFPSSGEYNLTPPPSPQGGKGGKNSNNSGRGKKFKKKEKKGNKKMKKSEKKGKGKKKLYYKKKHNYITVLTHLYSCSWEGNPNDISFPLFLNSDIITFPKLLRGRDIQHDSPKNIIIKFTTLPMGKRN